MPNTEERLARRDAKASAPISDDPWHVGELPGDGGLAIRDQNAWLVAEALSSEAAAAIVAQHNATVTPALISAAWDALSFMQGFEGDEMQEGIDDKIEALRDALEGAGA